MKKIRKSALPVIFILHLYPVLHVLVALVSSTLETRWRLTYGTYPLAYAIIVFIATLAGAIFRRQIMPEKGFGKACAPFLLPVALLNVFFACFGVNLASAILVVLSSVCALIIFLVADNKKWKRVLSFVFSFIFALFVTITLPVAIFFNDFGTSSVVQKVKSPDGKYVATLTDIDNGALGGETLIDIMKRPIPLPLGKFTTRIYRDWDYWAGAGVLSEITFEWADNDTLIYGSSEIDIGE